MSIYTPDHWRVIEVKSESRGTVREVLAGWSGCVVYDPTWKISSSIVNVSEYPDRYEFMTKSSSMYVCFKDRHSISELMQKQLTTLQSMAAAEPEKTTVTLITYTEEEK
ncbi:hypothetical protein UFOVP116_187 [uncultured Caudovirales phage]|uniref:Uncharacterized protein n=1 Tax=uncultured Caudovirales phage TaxID=2100421 RepID=A0A6J5L761_9CAUD|nr:hypothetical protein UFOVP116_187 [uncultured Caudovirales phage]